MSERTLAQTEVVEAQRDQVARVVGDVEGALEAMEREAERAKEELKEIREEVGNVRELVPKVRGYENMFILPAPSAMPSDRLPFCPLFSSPVCDAVDRVGSGFRHLHSCGRAAGAEIAQDAPTLTTSAIHIILHTLLRTLLRNVFPTVRRSLFSWSRAVGRWETLDTRVAAGGQTDSGIDFGRQ